MNIRTHSYPTWPDAIKLQGLLCYVDLFSHSKFQRNPILITDVSAPPEAQRNDLNPNRRSRVGDGQQMFSQTVHVLSL